MEDGVTIAAYFASVIHELGFTPCHIKWNSSCVMRGARPNEYCHDAGMFFVMHLGPRVLVDMHENSIILLDADHKYHAIDVSIENPDFKEEIRQALITFGADWLKDQAAS
jgi:hypothetical protein